MLAELLELQVNFAKMTPAVQDGTGDVPCIQMIQYQRESCACVNANAMDRYNLHRCTLRHGYDGRENAWNRNNWGRYTQSHLSAHDYGNGDAADPCNRRRYYPNHDRVCESERNENATDPSNLRRHSPYHVRGYVSEKILPEWSCLL